MGSTEKKVNRVFVVILFCLVSAGSGWGSSSVVFFQEATTAAPPGAGLVGMGGMVQAPPPPPPSAPQNQQPGQGEVEQPPAPANRGQRARPQPARPAPPKPTGPTTVELTPTTGEGGPGVKLNFSNAPIDRVVNSIMQELGYSYLIDPQVQGTVNIFTMREIPRARLFEVLEQLLKMNGQAIIKQDDLYVILPINQSPTIPHGILMENSPEAEPKLESPRTGEGAGSPENPPQAEAPAPEQAASSSESGEEASPAEGPQVYRVGEKIQEPGVITYIIPLHYIPSDQMLQMAQAFISPGATVVDFMPANLILLTDYRKNVEQVLNLVEILDTNYFHLNKVDLIPIRFNQAVDVAEDLGKIFAPNDQAAGVRIVAIERLNSILVITRAAAVFEEVTNWIDKLDTPSSTSNLKTFVYQVENNTAVQIAQILAELYQDGLGLPSAQTGDIFGGENGAAGGQSGLGSRAQSLNQRAATREPGFVTGSQFDSTGRMGTSGSLGMRELGPALSKDTQSQIRSIVAGNVKIVVNEFNNSLIIQGTEADIQFILETVKQLDTLPRQALIEAQIYGVTLRDDLSFGVAAFLQKQGASAGDSGTIPPATTGSIGTDPAGQLSIITRAVIGGERELQAIVNALRSKTDVEMVDAPRVLAMDGTPASINIGAEVPVTSASFGNPLQSGTTNFVNSIQFRPTGTTLLIVPRISASGLVTMDVVLEVSSATGPALTPTINRTYVQTSFLVDDGQTVGIAGLISDSYSVGKDRVPVLGDIPILGALFGQTTQNTARRELIIFITPRVIRNLPTATELTLDFKRALRKAYDYINKMDEAQNSLIEERRQEELKQEEVSEQEVP